ncbi:S1C family serine protease [uncultured Croceitalea sp.]|uniref:S1C family serine protease n=1 Tax=uncultured Croceitalea sp. TaxID=1798908 RepID=UPI00374EEA6C
MKLKKKSVTQNVFWVLICVLSNSYALGQDFTELYQEMSHSVVYISRTKPNRVPSKDYVENLGEGYSGTGFLISKRRVITPSHVVDFEDDIYVQFNDGQVTKGRKETNIEGVDLAIFTLDEHNENSKAVKLGNSDDIRIGDRLFSIGAPFGFPKSFYSGNLSNKVSNIGNFNPFFSLEYLQSDIYANSGSSGSPVFNGKGEVIGIMQHILTTDNTFQGSSFALSSNIIKRIIIGKERIWRGANLHPLSFDKVEFALPQENGLLVVAVDSDSFYGDLETDDLTNDGLAYNDRLLQKGDIILSINGIKIEFTSNVLSKIDAILLASTKNNPISVKVLRDGKILHMKTRSAID